MALAVVGPSGRVLQVHRHPTLASEGAERVVRDLASCITGCLGKPGRSAAAVGIGVAGQVNRAGVVRTSPNLGWRNIALRRLIEEAVARPVIVANDLRAITYGEWRHGAARGARDAVCVFVGTGVGGGVVADGQLLYGATWTAGEVGHTTLVVNGRKCHCPNAGCLEAYVGGWAIAERAQEAARADPGAGEGLIARAGTLGGITAETVAEAAQGGDPLARRLLRETSEFLGAGLVGVVNAFNPQVLVLGGGVIDGSPGLFRASASWARSHALAVASRRVRIVRAGLGDRAGVIGAAGLARQLILGGN
jgi:glucokinase